MNPTDKQILDAINESGYLFEQEIGSILEKNEFHIHTNAAFKDEDEEKSREIDVMAYRRFYYNTENKTSIAIRIICECKNNQNPFVFINRNKSIVDKSYCPPNFLFPQKEFKSPIPDNPNSFYIIPAFKHYKLDESFPYSLSDKKAVQFCKIIRKGKDWNAFHDGIYDSILIPVIKCLEYYKRKDSRMLNSEWKNYYIYFPVVVLNSKIYALDSHLTTEKLDQVEHISFTRDIDSKKIEGKYLIDFVTKDGLENYIKAHIITFVDSFLKKIAPNP